MLALLAPAAVAVRLISWSPEPSGDKLVRRREGLALPLFEDWGDAIPAYLLRPILACRSRPDRQDASRRAGRTRWRSPQLPCRQRDREDPAADHHQARQPQILHDDGRVDRLSGNRRRVCWPWHRQSLG